MANIKTEQTRMLSILDSMMHKQSKMTKKILSKRKKPGVSSNWEMFLKKN